MQQVEFDYTQQITIVTLSEAKGLVLPSKNEILRRFAPQNDTAWLVLVYQPARLFKNRDLLIL